MLVNKINFSLLLIHFRCDLHRQHSHIPLNGLQQHPSRSRSVPEGLAHSSSQHGCECHANCPNNRWRSSSFRHYRNRPVQVVEQNYNIRLTKIANTLSKVNQI